MQKSGARTDVAEAAGADKATSICEVRLVIVRQHLPNRWIPSQLEMGVPATCDVMIGDSPSCNCTLYYDVQLNVKDKGASVQWAERLLCNVQVVGNAHLQKQHDDGEHLHDAHVVQNADGRRAHSVTAVLVAGKVLFVKDHNLHGRRRQRLEGYNFFGDQQYMSVA